MTHHVETIYVMTYWYTVAALDASTLGWLCVCVHKLKCLYAASASDTNTVTSVSMRPLQATLIPSHLSTATEAAQKIRRPASGKTSQSVGTRRFKLIVWCGWIYSSFTVQAFGFPPLASLCWGGTEASWTCGEGQSLVLISTVKTACFGALSPAALHWNLKIACKYPVFTVIVVW